MDFQQRLEKLVKDGVIPSDLGEALEHFYLSYSNAIKAPVPSMDEYLNHVVEQFKNPFVFAPFHEKITSPTNYYQFGLNFIRPLVMKEQSTVLGMDQLKNIDQVISQGDNVIFLANHQI